jgi:hypothetical protein
MDREQCLRETILRFLDGGEAHVPFRDAVADLPSSARGQRAPGIPHTPWRLVEHMPSPDFSSKNPGFVKDSHR